MTEKFLLPVRVHGGAPFVFRMHWDHEPVVPLSRPRLAATLSPARSGGEGRERGKFMGFFVITEVDCARFFLQLKQSHDAARRGRGGSIQRWPPSDWLRSRNRRTSSSMRGRN